MRDVQPIAGSLIEKLYVTCSESGSGGTQDRRAGAQVARQRIELGLGLGFRNLAAKSASVLGYVRH